MSHALLRGDLPLAVVEAAQDTLGAALSVAQGLDGQVRANLANAARSAFVVAFQTATLASAVITLLAAVATALVLGRPSPEGAARNS